MVPEAGIEPAWCFHRQILSLLRLPISPLRPSGRAGSAPAKGADYGMQKSAEMSVLRQSPTEFQSAEA